MEIINKYAEERNGNFAAKLLYRFLPYWPVFLSLFLLALLAAWLYIFYATPLYQASARILIKDEKKGAEDSKTLEALNGLSTKKIIENEIEVIQSRSLVTDVVKSLHLYAPVYHKKKFKNISAYTSSPITIQAKEPDHIKQVSDVELTVNNIGSKVIMRNAAYNLNEWVNTPYGELRFASNKNYIKESDNTHFSFSLINVKSIASSIEKRLDVSTKNKLTSILILNFKDEVPQRGEDILNALLAAYNNANVADKNMLASNTISFINDRLKAVEEDLNAIEGRIQKYKAQKGAVDISMQGRLYLENVSQNDQKMSEVNMQLAVLNQVENYVMSKNESSGIVPSTLGVSDPVLSQLVDKLYAAELEYEGLKKTTPKNNPTLVAITDQIEKIKPGILENIRSQRNSLQASRNNLAVSNNTYTSMLSAIPQKERELIDINREQGIKNEIYSFLLQKREEAALSHRSTVSDSRVIDKAESSDSPVSPKKKVIYFSAFLIALFGGLGTVTVREGFSHKIMFRREIETLTSQPVIGEIASENSKDPIVIGDNKKTFIAEQFRRLRATLSFIGVSPEHKKILVTSAISGEGKSFVASNLALTLALSGKKVVLLDFDLNNPSLNNKLNLNEDRGISDFLLGESNVESLIRQTDLHRNLFLIPTGKLPSNPTELIMNGRVGELLNYLEKHFDYIIIDTAPVVPVTDAYILSPYCDATLYVIRHGYTPKTFVQQIDEDKKMNHLNNVGIVFNGISSRGFGNKNYGYGYGYGYQYSGKKNKYRQPSHIHK